MKRFLKATCAFALASSIGAGVANSQDVFVPMIQSQAAGSNVTFSSTFLADPAKAEIKYYTGGGSAAFTKDIRGTGLSTAMFSEDDVKATADVMAWLMADPTNVESKYYTGEGFAAFMRDIRGTGLSTAMFSEDDVKAAVDAAARLLEDPETMEIKYFMNVDNVPLFSKKFDGTLNDATFSTDFRKVWAPQVWTASITDWRDREADLEIEAFKVADIRGTTLK